MKAVPAQATYLMWLDCREITENVSELCSFIREKTGLYLTDGTNYRGNGGKFLRMNVACSKSILSDGLSRLKNGVEAYKKHITANN